VAFSDTVRALVRVDSLPGVIHLAVVAAVAVTMVATRVHPSVGEPDVHDRELDLIAGVLLLAAATWLSLGPAPSTPVMEPTTRDVLAITSFLLGAGLLVVGTRIVMRLQWVFLLPLLALPVVTEHVFVAVALTAVVVLVAAQPLLWRSPAGRHAPRGGRRRETRAIRQLPPLMPAGGFTIVLACLLALSDLHAFRYLASLL
jgi:hypothetical protein